MPLLNIDDNYPNHRKVSDLSDKAFRLHVAAMTECARHLLDGYLSLKRLSKLDGYRPAMMRELLQSLPDEQPLLHPPGAGCGTKTCPEGRPGEYLLHDYLHWNRSREWWTDRRRKEAERQAEWRAKKAAERELEDVG